MDDKLRAEVLSSMEPAKPGASGIDMDSLRAEGLAALGGATAAGAGWQPPEWTSPAPGGPPADARPPTPEASRALRMTTALGNAEKRTVDYATAAAYLQDMERRDPDNPNLPDLRAYLEKQPGGMDPMSYDLEAALRREAARRGVMPPELGKSDAPTEDFLIHRGLEQRRIREWGAAAPAVERAGGSLRRAGQMVGSAWRSPYNPLKYPVEALGALLRPVDKLVPGLLAGAISPKLDPVTTALANMDPLGRRTLTGAEVPMFQGQSVGYGDVLNMAIERWGHPIPGDAITDDQGRELLPARKNLGGFFDENSLPTAAAGFVADLLLSPSTYLAPRYGAPADASTTLFKGTRPAMEAMRVGPVEIPGKAISAVARLPGSALEKTPLGAKELTLPGGAKLAVKDIGMSQAVEGLPGAIGRIPVPGKSTTVGDVVGGLLNRYHEVGKTADPELRAALLSAARLRDSSTAADVTRNSEILQRAMSGLSLEEQRLVREAVENPGAVVWDAAPPRQVPQVQASGETALARPSPAGYQPIPPARALAVPGSTPAAPPAAGGLGPREIPVGAGPGTTVKPGLPGPQVPQPSTTVLTPSVAEAAARVENLLRDFKRRLQERSGLGGGPEIPGVVREHADAELMDELARFRGRDNYFPRERTAESLRADRGPGVRTEPTGAGQGGRPTTQYGFRMGRTEPGQLNEIIDRLNKARAAEGKPLIPNVDDTTASLNNFWRNLPEELRAELGGSFKGEAERFLDKPLDALQRYSRRATKAINDYDYMNHLRGLKDSQGQPLARVIVRQQKNGQVVERAPFEPATADARAPDKLAQANERVVHGYSYPANPSWREAFPNVALPDNLSKDLERLGKPYWTKLEAMLVRPLHKVMLPWKVAATSGAGPRFAMRNYYSQQLMNLQEYGPAAAGPEVQRLSHVLALPDEALDLRTAWTKLGYPEGLQTKIHVGGGQYVTLRELRETAKQTGLWRTMPEGELWTGEPPGVAPTGAAHSSVSTIGRAMDAAQRANAAIGPFNPFSKNFVATRGLKIPEAVPVVGGSRVGFAPMAEYFERQGRMAALVLELRRGKSLIQGAQDASKVHVDYGAFSPAFEKYGTLWAPFAKFTVGRVPTEIRNAVTRPGMAMVPSRIQGIGEQLVRPQERQRFESEPRSDLIAEAGGRLTGWPWTKGLPLMEEAGGPIKGPYRLPYTSLSPFANQTLNILGAPGRVAAGDSTTDAVKRELFENAFPAQKALIEFATGENVATGEPISLHRAQPAPRLVQEIAKAHPELAAKVFRAAWVDDGKKGSGRVLMTPGSVNILLRYYPNVAAADLVAGLLGSKKAYDNDTAMLLRLLGMTQVLHDPMVPQSQRERTRAELMKRARGDIESWLPAQAQEQKP